VRSTHPLFSVVAWGENKDRMLRVEKDSFGPESSFATLRELDAKIVLFGVTFEACTFLHYVEQEHQVPYRFIKTFDGTFIDKEGKGHEDSCTYFVRPLDENIDNDMTRITPYLREKKLVKEGRVGNGEISVVAANDLYAAGMRLLDADPYYLLAQASS
jgi:aminoglycoside 3-N-acetyltransferase